MSQGKSDSEVFEFAIAREVQAYHFYMEIAKRSADAAIQRVFEGLAQEELEHKRKLELEMMKMGLTVEVQEDPGKPTRKYVISNTDEPLDMDYKDMLLLAIAKEDAAFRTYISMLPLAYDDDSREVLLGIAQEEVKHKYRFEAEYDMLLKQDSA